MCEAVVFAGTSEGRQICAHLADRGVSVCMCVATAYGRDVAGQHANIHVHTGGMDAEGMSELIRECSCVVDATHPYARQATENIVRACGAAKKPYYRLLRPKGNSEGCVTVADARQAATYLRDVEGNVLLTTGSKDLMAYGKLDVSRLYPRVLPTRESLTQCEALGVPQCNIICMQGPFSVEMNAAMLEHTKAKFLVTKDSGRAGGCQQKLDAAKQAGVTVIVVGRPCDESGYSMGELMQLLAEREGTK